MSSRAFPLRCRRGTGTAVAALRHRWQRVLLLLLLGAALPGATAAARDRGAPPPAAPAAPPKPDTEAWQRDFDGWWARQREREASDRFWNGPREQRRNLTRDQIEFWERRKERQQRTPSWPF